MTKQADLEFTHFETSKNELPPEYYFALGRCHYRWSQLELCICALAVSLLKIPWLEAVERLRGNKGFAVKNIFQQLESEVKKRGGDAAVLKAVDDCVSLHTERNILFHSAWGFLSGPHKWTVGIQEWSNTSFDNFRCVSLEELNNFATCCHKTKRDLLKLAIPYFHGSTALSVDEAGNLVPEEKD